MNTNTILLLAIPLLVVAAGLLIFGAARRRDTSAAIGVLSSETKTKDKGPFRPAEDDDAGAGAAVGAEIELAARETYRGGLEKKEPPAPPVAWVPPEPEAVGVSRRQFFNRSAVTLMSVSSGVFGVAIIGFLWPGSTGGFGGTISLGRSGDLDELIAEGNGFAYFPEGRLWLTQYPRGALASAEAVYDAELAGMEAGYVALWQTCPHLGCRVPECATSQWFECPCHGSKYNRVGEYKAGPAPRGMDRFPIEVSGDTLSVNTGETIPGPPKGTNTTGQEAEGPFCV